MCVVFPLDQDRLIDRSSIIAILGVDVVCLVSVGPRQEVVLVLRFVWPLIGPFWCRGHVVVDEHGREEAEAQIWR